MLYDVCVVILLFSSTLVGRKYTLTTSKVDVVIVVLIGFDALLRHNFIGWQLVQGGGAIEAPATFQHMLVQIP